MIEQMGGDLVGVIVAGLGADLVACALFARVAASRKNPVGVFVLGALACCGAAGLALVMAIA